MDILTILIFSIYEHGISFHFCLQFLSSISYSFQCIGLSPPFIIFDAIVNVIVFLISLSDSSLLVYRNATNFVY